MKTSETQASFTSSTPILFDADGFLLEPTIWSEQLCRDIAELDGIAPLDDKHWAVIHHVRGKYYEVGGLPTIRLICRATNVTREEIYRRFGGCRAIWRVAGLPNPGEEAKAYFI